MSTVLELDWECIDTVFIDEEAAEGNHGVFQLCVHKGETVLALTDSLEHSLPDATYVACVTAYVGDDVLEFLKKEFLERGVERITE